MNLRKLADNMSILLGALALALLMGALGFQYIGRYAPCELCHYQRWPLIGAAVIGLIGGFGLHGRNPAQQQIAGAAAVALAAAVAAYTSYELGIVWPLLGAILIGLVTFLAARGRTPAAVLITATVFLVAFSGAIGLFHAGVELTWWKGPAHCTGRLYIPGAPVDPNAYTVVPCDKPAYLDPLFGLSLAAYNAIFCLGASIAAALTLLKAKA